MKHINGIRIRPLISIVALASILFATSGCMLDPVVVEDLRSDLEREISPDVNSTVMKQVVTGNSEFAFRLYQQLNRNDNNLIYSPYSISAVLAMTYAGARGTTEKEMKETLAFRLPQDDLHPAFNALDLELASRSEPFETYKGEQDGPELILANALWGQAGHPFLPEFLDLLALNYGAGMQLIDFQKSPEAARRAINAWVSDQTRRRIKDLVPPGSLNTTTRLVLANAIYFNADWASPFERHSTRRDSFNLLDGNKVVVPMMNQGEIFLYADGDGFQLIELPYVKREMVMDILLPDPGKFHDVEDALNGSYVSTILHTLDYQSMILTMPKFQFESDFSLSDTLNEMGMPSAFSSTADFSGMDGARDLEISKVLHKAFISVDEKGTEAAAASTVFAQVISGLGPAIEVRIDRPFIFWIRDLPSGTILFIGRVMNPSR
jgi:serpin B